METPRFAVAPFTQQQKNVHDWSTSRIFAVLQSFCSLVQVINTRGSSAALEPSLSRDVWVLGLSVPWLSISRALKLPAKSWRMLMTFSCFSLGSALSHVPAPKPCHSSLGGPGLRFGLALIPFIFLGSRKGQVVNELILRNIKSPSRQIFSSDNIGWLSQGPILLSSSSC